MTVVNPSDKAVTLKRNCKLADVFPCLAVEDLDVFQGSQAASEKEQPDTGKRQHDSPSSASLTSQTGKSLSELGLSDVDVASCQVSEACKSQLKQLITIRTSSPSTRLTVVRSRDTHTASVSLMIAHFACHTGESLQPTIRS